MDRTTPRRIATAILSIFVLAFAAPAQAQTKLTPVSLRTDIFINGSHIPLLVGIVDGIYKKHGLDVTIAPGQGSATTIQTVANGSDNFGYADAGTLIRLAAQGLKAKDVFGILQRNPMLIMAMPDGPIKKPADLDGKTGGFTAGSAPEQLFPAFAKRNGVNDASVKQIVVDIPTRDSIFLAKKTDFTFGYSVSQLPLLEDKCKCTLVKFYYGDHGIPSVSNGIIVSDKFAAEHPDLVKAFVQATAEALAIAVKDPKHGVDDFFAFAKDSPVSHDVIARQFEEAMKLYRTPATQRKPYGMMDNGDWTRTIDLLVQNAGVAAGAVKPADVFTNQYVPK